MVSLADFQQACMTDALQSGSGNIKDAQGQPSEDRLTSTQLTAPGECRHSPDEKAQTKKLALPDCKDGAEQLNLDHILGHAAQEEERGAASKSGEKSEPHTRLPEIMDEGEEQRMPGTSQHAMNATPQSQVSDIMWPSGVKPNEETLVKFAQRWKLEAEKMTALAQSCMSSQVRYRVVVRRYKCVSKSQV